MGINEEQLSKWENSLELIDNIKVQDMSFKYLTDRILRKGIADFDSDASDSFDSSRYQRKSKKREPKVPEDIDIDKVIRSKEKVISDNAIS